MQHWILNRIIHRIWRRCGRIRFFTLLHVCLSLSVPRRVLGPAVGADVMFPFLFLESQQRRTRGVLTCNTEIIALHFRNFCADPIAAANTAGVQIHRGVRIAGETGGYVLQYGDHLVMYVDSIVNTGEAERSDSDPPPMIFCYRACDRKKYLSILPLYITLLLYKSIYVGVRYGSNTTTLLSGTGPI